MKRIAMVLVILLLGAVSEPTLTPTSCAEEHWTEAESIVSDQVAGPITGITATLSTLNFDAQLLPCLPSDRGGFSAALVNLAAYDRHGGAGGEMVQLGIVRGTWSQPDVFMYTQDNSGGGMQHLGPPYPEDGRSYTFSIIGDGARWQLSVTDRGEVLHRLWVPRHWTAARSAWLMFEALTGGSLVGAGDRSDAPSFSGLRVETAAGSIALDPPPCDTRRLRWRDEWVIDHDVDGVVCGVAGDRFFAYQRPSS